MLGLVSTWMGDRAAKNSYTGVQIAKLIDVQIAMSDVQIANQSNLSYLYLAM